MIAQMNSDGEEVSVCLGCGLPDQIDPYLRSQPTKCNDCRLREGEEREECTSCEDDTFIADLFVEELFLSPFDDEPTVTGFKYCTPCLDQGNDNIDGTQFYCDGCSREILSDNGRMVHYRILNECEQICIKCISEDLLAGGIAALNDDGLLDGMFDRGQIFGMFFNVGELEGEGWTPDPDFHDYRVEAPSADALGARAQEHHEAGRLIIIEYERLSIIGDEGYVTLYTKEAVWPTK